MIGIAFHRRDRQLVPEGAAVLAVVAQYFAAGTAFGQRLANARSGKLVPVIALQETAILVKDLVAAVAGQALERRVDVDQNGVIAFLFGDHDAVVGRIDHRLQQLCVDHVLASRQRGHRGRRPFATAGC
ncbi:hypothetical protein D3C73_1380150 [compost metagenome]